jgi:hypothetical protein
MDLLTEPTPAPNGIRGRGRSLVHRFQQRRWLWSAELALTYAGCEGIPFTWGEDEGRSGRVLAVADADRSTGQTRDFHALCIGFAVAALAPLCTR